MSVIRIWFLRLTIPLQKWMQKIHRPEYKVRGAFFYEALYRARRGDILLSREDWHLTNPFIPGFWKHACLYDPPYVIEAVGEGVRRIYFAEWCLTKDYVAIYRAPEAWQPWTACSWASRQQGKKYDFLFEDGDCKEFFCSELVEASFQYRFKRHFESFATMPTDFTLSPDLQLLLDSRTFP